jgi:hypothetical protein
MTMASGLYVVTWRDIADTTGLAVDMLSASNIVCLYTDTKTPNFDTDAAHSATNELATGGGYTQDTKTVGGTPTFALGNAGQLKYSWSAAVQFTSATFTARGMIIGKASTLEPICSVTFGSDFTATAGNFTITAHANGIFYIDLVP